MSLKVKVALIGTEEVKEIRRFTLKAEVQNTFNTLRRKIQEIFPFKGNFSMMWKDNEGDLVTFSSDGEMSNALGCMTDETFKVFIQRHESDAEQNKSMTGIICNWCNGPVGRIGYRCCVCPQYVLCPTCRDNGVHTAHDLLQMTGLAAETHGKFLMCRGIRSLRKEFVPSPQMLQWVGKTVATWHRKHGDKWCGIEEVQAMEVENDASKTDNEMRCLKKKCSKTRRMLKDADIRMEGIKEKRKQEFCADLENVVQHLPPPGMRCWFRKYLKDWHQKHASECNTSPKAGGDNSCSTRKRISDKNEKHLTRKNAQRKHCCSESLRVKDNCLKQNDEEMTKEDETAGSSDAKMTENIKFEPSRKLRCWIRKYLRAWHAKHYPQEEETVGGQEQFGLRKVKRKYGTCHKNIESDQDCDREKKCETRDTKILPGLKMQMMMRQDLITLLEDMTISGQCFDQERGEINSDSFKKVKRLRKFLLKNSNFILNILGIDPSMVELPTKDNDEQGNGKHNKKKRSGDDELESETKENIGTEGETIAKPKKMLVDDVNEQDAIEMVKSDYSLKDNDKQKRHSPYLRCWLKKFLMTWYEAHATKRCNASQQKMEEKHDKRKNMMVLKKFIRRNPEIILSLMGIDKAMLPSNSKKQKSRCTEGKGKRVKVCHRYPKSDRNCMSDEDGDNKEDEQMRNVEEEDTIVRPELSPAKPEEQSGYQTQNSSPKNEEDWTVLNKDSELVDIPHSKAIFRETETSHDPAIILDDFEIKLQEVLNQMLSMGFHDEGGWLTELLRENDCDVNMALKSIMAKTEKGN